MRHCTTRTDPARSCSFWTIHIALPTHSHPLFTTRPQPDHSLPRQIPRQRTGMCPVRARCIDRDTQWFRVVTLRISWHNACSMSLRVRRLGRPPERGLEPDFRKEDGGSGQKARAGRQPESRQAHPGNGETPGTSREGFFAVKAEGGGDVKAFPRCTGRAPGGAEAHEGSGSVEA